MVIHTDKLALPQQLQMCPEDVVDVVGHKLDEVVVRQLTQLNTSQIKLLYRHAFQAELCNGPLQPKLHLFHAPVHWI